MSYTVLARKYRPQTFMDLVGQEHVSRTLANAIGSERVAHAFLFTGARGVGKTTTARLLAKALNCERGPSATPCNQCDACREIALGTDIDVLEIDGASNNSVDDVRRLQETLPFRPARDRFKVVIVDEVHMLSTGAFNAFLKTLEEPPSHVKFIFATTEAHKVPITIRSRCQRYDFRLIPHAVIVAHLRGILAQEQIEADDAAITLVAREAAGSMRDALTVLDQVLALGEQTLRGEIVAQTLGVAGRKHVWGCIEAVLGGDAAGCLRSVGEVVEQGLDVLHFTRSLLECARDLVVLKVVQVEDELLELAPEERVDAQRIAGAHAREDLERLFSGLSLLVEEVGLAGMPKLALEMGLVRLADRPPLVPLRELLERLSGLEARLGAGAAGSGGGGVGGADRRGPRPGSGAPSPSYGTGPRRTAPAADGDAAQPPAARGANPSAPRAHPDDQPLPAAAAPASQAAPPSQAAPASRLDASAPPRTAQPTANTASAPGASGPSNTAGAAQAAATREAAPQPAAAPAHGSAIGASQSAASATAATSATAASRADDKAGAAAASLPESAPEPAARAASAAPGRLGGAWLDLVLQLKTSQPALAAVLEHGTPLEVTPSVLKIGFPENSFFGRQAQTSAAREQILRVAQGVLGARPELVLVRATEAHGPTLAALAESSKQALAADRREAALRHPRVQEALEVFEESEQTVDIHVEP